jgi:hypothetical protein
MPQETALARRILHFRKNLVEQPQQRERRRSYGVCKGGLYSRIDDW